MLVEWLRIVSDVSVATCLLLNAFQFAMLRKQIERWDAYMSAREWVFNIREADFHGVPKEENKRGNA